IKMAMRKKVFWSLLIIVMIVGLAACGGDNKNDVNNNQNTDPEENTDNGNGETTGDDEQVTIVYARGVDTSPATESLIIAFEEKHPNIKVEQREMPADTGQSHDQYVTAFSSQSNEIDVFNADVIWPAEFAQADYALELDRFIDRD